MAAERKDSKEYDPMDGTIAAPDSHKVILESEKARVLSVIIPPGVKEPYHTHSLPSIMIVYSSPPLQYFINEQEFSILPSREIDPEKPHTEFMEPEGLHAVKNLGDIEYRATRIELKIRQAYNKAK